jgi:hypothetical protein
LTAEVQSALVRAIVVVDASADLHAMRKKIVDAVRMTAPRDKLEAFVERLEGWWWSRVARALTRPDDARISVAEVESNFDELREAFQRTTLPIDMAYAEPPQEEAAAYDNRPFVRQLALVGIAGRRLDFAKRDFYRAFEQRSRWTREELLFDGEITDFERRLIEEWEARFEPMKDKLGGSEDETRLCREGQRLVEWVEQDARFPLRSIVERFLNVGSFHMLADRLRVGWHRDFARRLKGNNSKGE